MTPSPRVIAWGVGIVVCLIALLSVLSFLSDPFGIRSWFREREKDRVERIESDLSARTIESDGLSDQIERFETTHREIITIQSATASSVTEARSAPDATTTLSPDLLDVLARSDRSLCDGRSCSPAPTDDTP